MESLGDSFKAQKKAAGLISNDILRWFIGDLTQNEKEGTIFRRGIDTKEFGKILMFCTGTEEQTNAFLNAVAAVFKKEKHRKEIYGETD